MVKINQISNGDVIVIDGLTTTVYRLEYGNHIYVVNPDTQQPDIYPVCKRLQNSGKQLTCTPATFLHTIRMERKRQCDYIRRSKHTHAKKVVTT